MLIGKDSFGFHSGQANGIGMHHLLVASRPIEEEYINFSSFLVELSFLQTSQVLNRHLDFMNFKN